MKKARSRLFFAELNVRFPKETGHTTYLAGDRIQSSAHLSYQCRKASFATANTEAMLTSTAKKLLRIRQMSFESSPWI